MIMSIARWTAYERLENGARFQVETETGDAAEIEITLPQPDIVRLRMAPDKLGQAQDRLLVDMPESFVGSTFAADVDGLTLSSPRLHVRIAKTPWAISVTDIDEQPVVQQATDDRTILGEFELAPIGWERDESGATVRVRESLRLAPNERIYGLGERFMPIDQRGRRFDNWTRDALSTSSQRAYKPVPFYLSNRGYGLFVNTTARVEWDLGATSTISLGLAVEAAELDYFIIFGPGLNDVLRRYWRLTGPPPIPPKWSFGFWSSRNSYRSRAEVEEIAQGYRQRDIPCDVIHLDPWWMGPPSNWCDLSWDEQRFPEPAQMLAGLRQQGFRVCLWEHPYVPQGTDLYAEGAANGYFVQDEGGEPYLIPAWAGDEQPGLAVVDFTHPAARAWWQDKHRQLLAIGVATFKSDFGEWAPADGHYHDGTPGRLAHNLYPLLYNRAVFETVEQHGDGRGLVWSRATATGSQRYPVHWGGDCRATFDHMAASLRGGLNLILSGFGYWSHDIGGYVHESSPALYARWAQFGLFSSHARAHGTTPREPWVFGEEVEAIFRRYAKLRYRLLPYIYACAARTAVTGRPLMRPLLLDYPNDPTTHSLDLQYLFGDDFLVAPVFAEAADVPVYLPAGRWIDYWSKQAHVGPNWVRVQAPLDTLPLFVREGAVIPMGPDMSYVGEKPLEPLTLDIYPAAEGNFTLPNEGATPIKIHYQLERDGFTLKVEGYRGQVEAILNQISSPWDVRVDGLPTDAWEMHENCSRVRFQADGPTELSLKFDL